MTDMVSCIVTRFMTIKSHYSDILAHTNCFRLVFTFCLHYCVLGITVYILSISGVTCFYCSTDQLTCPSRTEPDVTLIRINGEHFHQSLYVTVGFL